MLEDRDRIARDLHDLVIQRLFATGLSVQATLGSLPAAAQPRINRVVDDLDETIKQIRRTIFELQTGPVALTLPAQLNALANDSATAMGHTAQIELHGDISCLSDELAADILTVLRECFANVARHAHADVTTARIGVDASGVRITVQDNGVGIDQTVSRRSGLANIRGGSCKVEPRPEGGTRVDWQAPTG